MFLRLFLTYLILVVLAAAAVGALILQRSDLSLDLVRQVALAVVVIAVVAALPASVLARRFTRPLDELTTGARRLAAGDFDHKIQISGNPELAGVARMFNSMTENLAESFRQLERDREQHCVRSSRLA